jgi:hypothetical protein
MNPRRRFHQRLLAASVLPLFAARARADSRGYGEVVDVKVETDQLIAEHHHDWGASSHRARWKMISSDQNVFTSENTYSFLRVIDRNSNVQKFRVPVPALRHLWISPDSDLIVGVSDVKLWNPIQLVVFNASGTLLFATAVDERLFPGVEESITNWVSWYKEPRPNMSLDGAEGSYMLTIEGNHGADRVFVFDDPAEKKKFGKLMTPG